MASRSLNHSRVFIAMTFDEFLAVKFGNDEISIEEFEVCESFPGGDIDFTQ